MAGTSRSRGGSRVTATALVLACAACFATACGVPGTPQASNKTASVTTPPTRETIRQTDDAGRPLPFTNGFPDRWSVGNDGTSYEPCTALNDDQLTSVGLDPWSVRDAALANKQTLRGCVWKFWDSLNSLSHHVGNQPPLDVYKRMYESSVSWRPDITLDGRIVAVGEDAHFPTVCSTYFYAGVALITTTISIHDGSLLIDEICAKAIEFTELTIGLVPN